MERSNGGEEGSDEGSVQSDQKNGTEPEYAPGTTVTAPKKGCVLATLRLRTRRFI